MPNRRAFLITSLVAITAMLSGCGSPQEILDISLLQGTIPPQLISDFHKSITRADKIKLVPRITLQKIFELLQTWQELEEQKPKSTIESLPIIGKNNSKQSNAATLGDFWLQKAIAENLIQPLDVSSLKNWDSLPKVWHELVKRDRNGYPSPQGEIYGAPYRYGNCVIAYRQDKLSWTPTDWSDLWREEVKGRVSLLNNYREVIGLTLKKLGYSYNTQNLSQVNNLTSELKQLHQQVKLYSSDKYLQPLVLGDTWMAIGWSTDIIPLTKRYSNVAIAVPDSGTSLWADMWVKPTVKNNDLNNSPLTNLLSTWIDFCWNTKSAKQILLFTDGLSPIFTAQNTQQTIKDLEKNRVFKNTLATFDKSEFLLPIPPETTAEYIKLWQQIRAT